jgi:DivIVA domain-containing protein
MPTSLPDHITQPEFAVAVRGYDRAQVDDYLGRVLEWLADAQERSSAAEEASGALTLEVVALRRTVAELEERVGMPPPQSMNTFGERLGEVMQSAMAAAEELRSEADREARDRREASAAECERMIGEASDESERILARAREGERAMADRIAVLDAKRATAVDDLRRIHDQLAEILGASGAEPAESEAPPVAANPEDTTVVEALAGTATLPGAGAGSDDDPGVSGPFTPTMVQPAVPSADRPQRDDTFPTARLA